MLINFLKKFTLNEPSAEPKDKILVFLPSKGRPEKYQEAVDSWKLCSTDGLSDCLAIIPEDWVGRYPKDPSVMTIVDTFSDGMVKAVNQAFFAYPDYGGYMFAADDLRFRTPGWDKLFLNALKAGAGVVYGNDLVHGETLPTHWCVDGDLVRAAGFYAFPNARHICCDVFWKDIALQLGRLKYIPEVVTEHLHFCVKKAEYDWVYEDTNGGGSFDVDREAYNCYASALILHDVKRIKIYLSKIAAAKAFNKAAALVK